MNAWLLASLTKVVFWLIRLLPVRVVGGLGAGFGRMAYYVVGRHRIIAMTNLTRIYPHKTRQWRCEKARASFAELGRTCFEFPHVFLRSKEFLLSRVEVQGEALLHDVITQNTGVFFAAAHHSNWELGGLMLSMLDCDPHIISRPLNNNILEAYLKKCRERFGAHVQSRLQGLRWLPKALRNGDCVAVMIDQHMSQGTPIPFLGHLGNTTTMPAAFVLRQQTPVIGVALERKGHGFHFTLRFWRIDMPELGSDKQANTVHVMQTISDSFAPVIHDRPESWLWLHRRWLILEQDKEIAKVVFGTP
ncbi:MAG: lauroyl acyltransferase [Mariprofundaceae bacterium]|nr:lauroyl acyltransferase [Mariprofundaceae bacterium]